MEPAGPHFVGGLWTIMCECESLLALGCQLLTLRILDSHPASWRRPTDPRKPESNGEDRGTVAVTPNATWKRKAGGECIRLGMKRHTHETVTWGTIYFRGRE
ncbi:uncharacterized protein CLUP02_00370 [Colletotrichum lupini]|uniref:Uncharacterized protein n=1 Tax=Colletotrichum lupini TaxID=145971 RepID=A0A9Q8SAM1_9PEZI|nr:uncharacterized protein CLUP02_00370 [Colletotrichum lupini]UQC73724.1 hypothetical protein CLUP02_00370 [Colletotrichum lupini]